MLFLLLLLKSWRANEQDTSSQYKMLPDIHNHLQFERMKDLLICTVLAINEDRESCEIRAFWK
jgi:hypothetical protein